MRGRVFLKDYGRYDGRSREDESKTSWGWVWYAGASVMTRRSYQAKQMHEWDGRKIKIGFGEL